MCSHKDRTEDLVHQWYTWSSRTFECWNHSESLRTTQQQHASLPHFSCSPIPSLWSCVLAATEKAKHPACFLCHLLMTGRAGTSHLWSQRCWQGRMLQWLTWEHGWHTGDSRICLATTATGPGVAKRSHKTAVVGEEHRWSPPQPQHRLIQPTLDLRYST